VAEWLCVVLAQGFWGRSGRGGRDLGLVIFLGMAWWWAAWLSGLRAFWWGPLLGFGRILAPGFA